MYTALTLDFWGCAPLELDLDPLQLLVGVPLEEEKDLDLEVDLPWDLGVSVAIGLIIKYEPGLKSLILFLGLPHEVGVYA